MSRYNKRACDLVVGMAILNDFRASSRFIVSTLNGRSPTANAVNANPAGNTVQPKHWKMTGH
ncbi:MAG: hypothetical protein ACLSEU_01380 [Streptococcus salivarius]